MPVAVVVFVVELFISCIFSSPNTNYAHNNARETINNGKVSAKNILSQYCRRRCRRPTFFLPVWAHSFRTYTGISGKRAAAFA
jgi:hypothetical protein